jgi:hypothetical protein
MSTTKKFSLKIRDYISTPERKLEYNEHHFSEAASRYDFATRAMSLGRDMAWKRQLVEAFLLVTTSETKNCFLLIKTFRKLVNTQNYGHLDQLWVAISYMSGSVRISHFSQFYTHQTM